MYSVLFTNVNVLLCENSNIKLKLLSSGEEVQVTQVTMYKIISFMKKTLSKFEARRNSQMEIQNYSIQFDNLNVYIDFSQNVIWISSINNNNFSYLMENEIEPFIKSVEAILNILPLISFIGNNVSISQQSNNIIDTQQNTIQSNPVNNNIVENQIQQQSTTTNQIQKSEDGVVVDNLNKLHEVINVIVATKKVKDITDDNLDALKDFMSEYWKIDTSKISNPTLRNILEDIIISIKDYLKNDNDIFALAGSVINNKNTKFIMNGFDATDDRSEKLKMIVTALFMKELLEIVNIAFTDKIV